MEFLKLLFIVLILIAIAFLGFAIRILIIKNGKFPQIHVGHNKEMRKRKIHCAKTIDKKGFVPNQKICGQHVGECGHCMGDDEHKS